LTPAPKNENLLRIVIVALQAKKEGKKMETKQITTTKVSGFRVQRFRGSKRDLKDGVRCRVSGGRKIEKFRN
jgi:hypothetical protein